MATYVYRVLFNGDSSEDTAHLPLATQDEMSDLGLHTMATEFCGIGCEGDFSGSEDGGRSGEVWEFVTTRPTAMEQALDADPNVLTYSSREGGLEG